MKSCFYIILFGLVLNSCTMDASSDSGFRQYITDTVAFPYHNEIARSKIISDDFRLPYIYEGVDSFELRIRIGGGGIVTYYPNFWRYRYNNERWILEISSGPDQNDSLNTLSVLLPEPKDSLVKFLSSDRVLNLPSQYAIPGFIDNIGDGQGIFVEIATKKFYKALSYHCPEHFVNEKNNREFMIIVNYLNRYFHCYNPWCKPEVFR